MNKLLILKEEDGTVLAVFSDEEKLTRYIRDRQAQTRVNGAPPIGRYDVAFVELNLSPEGKRY